MKLELPAGRKRGSELRKKQTASSANRMLAGLLSSQLAEIGKKSFAIASPFLGAGSRVKFPVRGRTIRR